MPRCQHPVKSRHLQAHECWSNCPPVARADAGRCRGRAGAAPSVPYSRPSGLPAPLGQQVAMCCFACGTHQIVALPASHKSSDLSLWHCMSHNSFPEATLYTVRLAAFRTTYIMSMAGRLLASYSLAAVCRSGTFHIRGPKACKHKSGLSVPLGHALKVLCALLAYS